MGFLKIQKDNPWKQTQKVFLRQEARYSASKGLEVFSHYRVHILHQTIVRMPIKSYEPIYPQPDSNRMIVKLIFMVILLIVLLPIIIKGLFILAVAVVMVAFFIALFTGLMDDIL